MDKVITIGPSQASYWEALKNFSEHCVLLEWCHFTYELDLMATRPRVLAKVLRNGVPETSLGKIGVPQCKIEELKDPKIMLIRNLKTCPCTKAHLTAHCPSHQKLKHNTLTFC